MSVLLANIAESLLPQLEGKSEQDKWEACAKDFPWYPMPWLALAKNNDTASKQKAAVWMEDEQRLHLLLNANSFSQDVWLLKNFDTIEENTLTATIIPEKEPAIQLAPNEIFLTESEEEIMPEAKAVVIQEEENFPQKFTLAGKFEQEEETEEEEDANDTDFVETTETETSPLNLNFNQNTDSQLFEKNTQSKTESKIKPYRETQKIAEPSPIVAAEVETPTPSIAAKAMEETIQTTSPIKEPAKPVAEPLAFEPYHVVDYFASQGIKVDVNDIPKTQLDRQMKSFTQWLKTMKKVAPTQDSAAPTDPLVDAQATSSLIKEDVITEAMAEVLEKQGMDKKAIEVYEKLILLHPEKSTFFAARIKDLKSK
jgi:hypothetical protein